MHRRTFSRKAKEEIVLETLKPGTTVADVARRYRIAERVLYRWRHDLGVGTPETEPGFASVQIVNNEQPAGTGAQP
jgi:transposase-like protein